MEKKSKIEIQQPVGDAIDYHEQVQLKMKGIGKRKPVLTGKGGDSLSTKTGKWTKREMTVDSEYDHYKEVVIDPETDTVIHYCEEPLSKHKGHGKRKDE